MTLTASREGEQEGKCGKTAVSPQAAPRHGRGGRSLPRGLTPPLCSIPGTARELMWVIILLTHRQDLHHLLHSLLSKRVEKSMLGLNPNLKSVFFFNAPMLACQPGGWQVHSRFWDILVPLLRWCWRKRSPPKLSALFGFLSKGS